MKQIITLAVTAMAAFSAQADYTALTFKTVGGESHSIGIPGLEIRFSDENLTASNSETSISLSLSQLESMEFSDAAPGAVGSLTADKLTEQTAVYDLNGRAIDVFPSFTDAMAGISSGVYLFRYADGTTLKIAKK